MKEATRKKRETKKVILGMSGVHPQLPISKVFLVSLGNDFFFLKAIFFNSYLLLLIFLLTDSSPRKMLGIYFFFGTHTLLLSY